jgi:hypothetical protein
MYHVHKLIKFIKKSKKKLHIIFSSYFILVQNFKLKFLITNEQ